MSTGRILSRIIIILILAILGASVGVCFQAKRITGKPQEFRSMAKLAKGSTIYTGESEWLHQQAEFNGTIIETLESAEMIRRALERVRALNPDLKDADVEIRVAQTKGSGIFNILATGPEPKYTKIFLDALLDEFIAFQQSIREQATGKVLQAFLYEVASRQKKMEASMETLEKLRAKVDTLSAKSDRERLASRLNSLRNQRDDLQTQLKLMNAADTPRAALEARLNPVEQEILVIETQLQRYEPDLAELRKATEKHAAEKEAYEKMFEQVEQTHSSFETMNPNQIAIQERATPAAENVEDWKMPVLVGAFGGGLFGALMGLLLSLFIVRSPRTPQIPAAL